MNEDSKKKDQFKELMKPWEYFFHETPVKGFLQSIDELFNKSFPFILDFQWRPLKPIQNIRLMRNFLDQ